jgi:hypothetical protein
MSEHESIATTAITAYAVHRAIHSTPKEYNYGKEDSTNPQFACYLSKKDAAWKCKLFDDWKQACKYALNEDRVTFRFIPVMSWVPRPILRRYLKYKLTLPIHTFYSDDNDLSK